MGDTSAGSIQIDLELQSNLDKNMQEESKKIADKIRKQMGNMGDDMFKSLRESIVASLDKITESIKSCLDKTKADMKAFIEQMSSMVKNMSGIQMPYTDKTQSKPLSVNSKSNQKRGPPGLKIKTPKIELDKQFETEMFQQEMTSLGNTFDILSKRIDLLIAKKRDLKKQLIKNEAINDAAAVANLKEEMQKLDAQILPLSDKLEKTSITLDAMERKMSATSASAVNTSSKFGKLFTCVSGFKGKLSSVLSNLFKTEGGLKKVGIAALGFTKKLAVSGLHKFTNGMKSAGKEALKFSAKLLGISTASKKASSGMGHASMSVGRLVKSFVIFS